MFNRPFLKDGQLQQAEKEIKEIKETVNSAGWLRIELLFKSLEMKALSEMSKDKFYNPYIYAELAPYTLVGQTLGFKIIRKVLARIRLKYSKEKTSPKGLRVWQGMMSRLKPDMQNWIQKQTNRLKKPKGKEKIIPYKRG